MIAEPTGTDGRPIIRKPTSVTGSQLGHYLLLYGSCVGCHQKIVLVTYLPTPQVRETDDNMAPLVVLPSLRGERMSNVASTGCHAPESDPEADNVLAHASICPRS